MQVYSKPHCASNSLAGDCLAPSWYDAGHWLQRSRGRFRKCCPIWSPQRCQRWAGEKSRWRSEWRKQIRQLWLDPSSSIRVRIRREPSGRLFKMLKLKFLRRWWKVVDGEAQGLFSLVRFELSAQASVWDNLTNPVWWFINDNNWLILSNNFCSNVTSSGLYPFSCCQVCRVCAPSISLKFGPIRGLYFAIKSINSSFYW